MSSKTLNAWSFSRWELYKNCPHQIKLKCIDRIQELPRPAPVKGKEHANDRGSRMHDNAELYVKGEVPELIAENKNFEDEFFSLKVMHSQHPDRVKTEELWLFDKDWEPLPEDAPKEQIWLRIIADLQVWSADRKQLHLVDYKSGKRDRNEVKHGKQLQLYQLAAFMRYPELEYVMTSLWYLDLSKKHDTSFTREKGLKYFPIFNGQAQHMCSDTEFKPDPSAYRCRFCPYGPTEHSNKWVKKNGACKYGVE